MRLLHYIEIENFKRFGDRQRIELGHPAVLIGPNNCGKTSAIQALALWSQAVKTWYDVRRSSTAKERTSVPLNRLNIVEYPFKKPVFFGTIQELKVTSFESLLASNIGAKFVPSP